MSDSITNSEEICLVAIGPIAVMVIFIGFSITEFFFAKGISPDFYPIVLCKFNAAFGVATILDPILILLVDLGYHNYACTQISDACKVDYTADSCDCFNGDFSKVRGVYLVFFSFSFLITQWRLLRAYD
jgi:hypothetical protein